MALYVVQHGKSRPKLEDPRQGLCAEGVADVQRIAQVAAQYQVRVSCILHSGKTRAAQTADLLAAALDPPQGIRQIAGIGPLDDAPAFASSLDLEKGMMIVGHLPFLERLVACLVTGRTTPPIFQMQNGGIVCLDYYPQTTQPVIRWALMPQVG